MPTATVALSFGEWLPDQPAFNLKGCVTATNVTPDIASYRSFPNLTLFSGVIGGPAKGAIFATSPTFANYNYVGDSSALYTLVNQSFNVATRVIGGAYTVALEDYWEFTNWGNTVIGVNGFVDLPQQISLGGVNFVDLSTGVKAKHITTMRDFVIMGNVSDSATNAYRVRWCAINNPTSWTVDTATLADFQDLPSEGGPVQKVLGGEYAVVFQQRSIWRMQFVGSPLIFQFDRVHNLIGAYVPQGVVRYQNLCFFLSEDGFYSFDGSNLNPIGRGKVDKFFYEDLSLANFQHINATVDPTNKIVMWAYPSNPGGLLTEDDLLITDENGVPLARNINGNPDKILCYSWAYNRWSLVEGLNISYFLQTITAGYTLEGLDVLGNLDTIGPSLDSIQWTGGQITMSAFTDENKLAYFNGSAMAATIETGEFQLFPNARGMILEVRPDTIGLSASATIAVLNRNNLTEAVSVGSSDAFPNSTGFVQTRCSARYFRIRLSTTNNTGFTHLIGVEVSGVPAGVR